VETPRFAFVFDFDHLRVDDEGRGRGGVSVFFRRFSFKSSVIFSQTPRSRMRQKWLYTVNHGGKSFGSNRHWQPVLFW